MKQRKIYITPTVELLIIEQQELLAGTNLTPGQTGSQGVYDDEGHSPEDAL